MLFGRLIAWLLVLALIVPAGTPVLAQQGPPPVQPQVGQAGKDVVWVPTPEAMVEKMLDLAEVTPDDFVVDLGSGDGRNVIGAAKRGARALGVEYNPDLVVLSRYNAELAGVADKATFVEGDMYEADFSEATVLALFLLPQNLMRLRPKFLELQPGARIVSNTFEIDDWPADETHRVDGECTAWCQVMLYIVPARVGGTWQTSNGALRLTQEFQMVSGTLTRDGRSIPVEGRLRGGQITLTAGAESFSGAVNGTGMSGTWQSGTRTTPWQATRPVN
jgi:SAM-dependent methyltransferase